MILVSHFLTEVLDLSDVVTILRDGQVVRTNATADETEASLVTAMLGRPVEPHLSRQEAACGRRPDRPGRRGPVGAGRHRCIVDVASRRDRRPRRADRRRAIGAGPRDLRREPGDGRRGPRRGTPPFRDARRDSIEAGVALIPESRKDDGLILRRSIRENVSLTSLRRFQRLGFVRRGAEEAQVRDALDRVTGSSLLEAPAGSLSGGNQQKLLFARALLIEPGVLLADEPTRGIDVGAKRDIYDVLVRLAGDGMAILLISNEVEEILGLAHRVLVMRAGRLVAELSGADMTEEAIVSAAFGASRTSAA